MATIYLLLTLMLCRSDTSQSRETIPELVSRLEPQLRERAAAARPLAVPLADPQFQQLVEAVVRQRVPVNAESEECRAHSQLVVDAVTRGETWALRMLDASSKFHSGVLDGRLIDSGYHHQCVRVEEPNHLFSGQHCLVEIRNLLPLELHLHFNYDLSAVPEAVVRVLPHAKDLGLSVCVPSSCSARDVQVHMDHVLAPTNASSILYDTSCSTNQAKPFRLMEWFGIAVFSGIAILVWWSTVKDLQSPCNKSAVVSSFSLRRSWQHLSDVRVSPEEVTCMAGIRVLFTVSTVFIHCFLKHLWDSSVSPLTVEQELGSLHILWIEFGFRSPEMFFLLGGITRSLGFLRERARGKPVQFGASVLQRYFRYTPTLAVVMLFSATLLMRCGSGPFWTRQTNLSVWGCCNLWFTGLLHIANLLYPQVACVQHSWYLSIDFQLFVISPLFLFPLYHEPSVGLMILAAFAAASVFAHFLVAIATCVDGPSLAILYKNRMGNEIVTEIYFSTLYRTLPYLLGLTLGYFIFTINRDNKRVSISKPMLWMGWGASLLALLGWLTACKVMLDPSYERIAWLDIGYTVLGKPLTAAVAAWLVMACHLGYGGVLNDFLSWRGFQPLSKLALGVYLVHFDIIRIQANRQSGPVQYDNFYFFHLGVGALMVSGLVAIVLFLCVEYPCYSLVSHYLRPTAATNTKFHLGVGALMVSGLVAVVLYLCVESPCYSLVSHYLRPTAATTIEVDKPCPVLATHNVNDTVMTRKRYRISRKNLRAYMLSLFV